ncbi:MAG TPA: hypothetical protein VFT37_01700 [Telluria sp.]|nr:hypothetical protein [Telluria sp.]
MHRITINFTGAALATVLIAVSQAAEVTPQQRESKVARYCTSCATVQTVRMNAARFELTVRYAGGETRILTYDNDPGFKAGDKVRVHQGVLTRDQ